MPSLTGHNPLKIPRIATAITASASPLARPGFAINAAVAGTVTLTLPGGTSAVVHLPVGVQVWIEHTHMTAATATGVVSFS